MDDSSGGGDSSSGPNWAQMLLTGVSAAIDSQTAQPYYVTNPVYNTAGGAGGQPQATGTAKLTASASPLVWIIGAVVLLVVLKSMGGKL
jgi:hypothetical protein